MSFSAAELQLLLEGLGALPPSPACAQLRERIQYLAAEVGGSELPQNQVAFPTKKTARRRGRQVACRRNGVALQTEPQKWEFVPDQGQSTNQRAHIVIAQLSVPSFNSLIHNPRGWLSSVQDAITMIGVDHSDPRHLPSIIQRCATLRSREVGYSFVMMISTIQLAFKCQRYASQCFPAYLY